MSAPVKRPQRGFKYVEQDGTLTLAGLELLDTLAAVSLEVQNGLAVTGKATTAVSMFVLARYVSAPGALNAGELVAGSSLFPTDAAGAVGATPLSGTWRLQGRIGGSATAPNEVSLWLRVLA